MHLCRFEHRGSVASGVLEEDRIVTDDGSVPRSEARLLAPCEPTKIVGCGLNYAGTVEESPVLDDDERAIPERPFLFLKPPSTVVGPGDDVVHPDDSGIHYEGELAVVVGERCRNVPAEDALDVLDGYTAMNDVTATDWPDREDQWVRAKGMDTFSPVGPCVRTDVSDLELDVETRVNGEVRQDANTRDLVFPVPELVAEVSRFMTLEPGDLLATGTPAGVGDLEPGDEVSVTVEGVGTLTNGVV